MVGDMKKSIFKFVSVLLVLTFLLTGFVGCGTKSASDNEEPNASTDAQSNDNSAAESSKLDAIKAKGTIVMGTNAEFPPFEYRNDKGEVDGFDAAIAKEIANEIGVELKIEDMAFDSLINALKSGKVDFVAAGMSVIPDRQENVDFSTEYYKASQKIIVKKDNTEIKGKDDLAGKKIGVQEGTTGDIEATEVTDKMSRFKKGIDAVMDLKNGKIDAVVIDANPAKVFVEKNDDLMILDEQFIEEDYAIAVDKGNEDLLEVINKVIGDLKESGKFDELVDQYINQ
jgi:ABC-type amino acid transport substrate-binding protein